MTYSNSWLGCAGDWCARAACPERLLASQSRSAGEKCLPYIADQQGDKISKWVTKWPYTTAGRASGLDVGRITVVAGIYALGHQTIFMGLQML